MATQCRSCGGIYESVQADGILYFHACPPLSAAEVDRAVKDGRVTLPPGETPEEAVARRTYERANKRDENRLSTAEAHAGTVKHEGDGTDELVIADTDKPVVVVEKPRV